MLARSAIAAAVAAVTAVLAGVSAGASQPRVAGNACSAPVLRGSVLRRGAATVHDFRRAQTRERASDLMGFRRGPRLAPPSSTESARIERARSLRGQIGLNPSTLLIRRLARDHSRRSQSSFLFPGLKVTAIEERDLALRDRFENKLLEVSGYGVRCARDVYGGLYVDAGRPWPARYRIVALFKPPVAPHGAALRTRFRYHGVLPLHAARHSLQELFDLQARVEQDRDDWRSKGYDVQSVGIDVRRNVVVAGISNPSPGATAAFRERYGSAVVLEPGV
jgi:hypothetical protein